MENEKIFWDNDLKNRIENFNKYDDYNDIVFHSKKEMEEKELEKFKYKKEYVLNFIKDKKVVNFIKLLIYQNNFLSNNENNLSINAIIPSNLDFDLNENSVRNKIETLYDFLQDDRHYIVYWNYTMQGNEEVQINLYNFKYDYENKKFYFLKIKNNGGKIFGNFNNMYGNFCYGSNVFEYFLNQFNN